MVHATDQPECWPALPLDSWKDTYATLQMWTQIVGKVRLRLTPLMNHWWNVPLYVTARGLTTTRIPYGRRAFELRFDFIRHQLVLETNDGLVKTLPLEPRSVAEFYEQFMELLRSAEIEVKIWRMPVEIPKPIAFDQDRVHASYDRASVEKLWRILLSVDTVFRTPRAGEARRRRYDSRSLFARSEQCWILAWRRKRRGCGVLFVRSSRAAGIQRQACPSGCCILRPATQRISPDVRRRAQGGVAHGLVT